MFRVLVKVPAPRLNRHKNGPSRLYKTLRYYSKKNDLCPPPVKSGGSGTVYTIGALVLVTGATVGYAKYDPEFRKWLTETAPFTDDFMKFVFQEDSTIMEKLSSSLDSIMSVVSNPEPYRKPEEVKEEQKKYDAPPPAFEKIAAKKSPSQDYAEIRMEKKVKGAPEPIVETLGAIKKELPKQNLEHIVELEKMLASEARAAIEAFNKSVYAVQNFNNNIAVVIEESVDRVDPTIWNQIKEKTSAKQDAIATAQKHAETANQSIAKLKEQLGKQLDVPEVLVQRTKANIQKVQNDIAAAKRLLDEELDKSKINEKYWDKVEKARNFFGKELEALFPTIDLQAKDITICSGDLDLFVLHAMSQVLYYQKELYRIETVAAQRLNNAIENAKRSGKCEILTTEQICQQLEKERRQLELDYKRKCTLLRNESEASLRNKLKCQSEAFSDHLKDALKTREMEVERLLKRKFDEELTEERCKFKAQIAAMVGRLRGMEEGLKDRADGDKSARQAQVLWSACQALFKSVKVGCPGVPWIEQLKPLNSEIDAVKNAAAKKDELVQSVIEGIPKEARERGVFPEDALRERFLKVEQVARSLALLPEEGGRLHMYFLSYIQSLLLLKSTNPIPQAELNDEKVDFSKLSTNEILQRARYWLDRGDFAQTLKYMNLLKGAPRSVAKQWMNETRILLETQQAANTLMAYAAASGLMYL